MSGRAWWLLPIAAVAVAALVWLQVRRGPTPDDSTPADIGLPAGDELSAAEEPYRAAIASLEEIAHAEKGALDPATAATLDRNLALVDQAIREGRAALTTEPDNEPVQQSLLASFKSKLALLQDTVRLINEMRKGDEAGTARVVSDLKKKG